MFTKKNCFHSLLGPPTPSWLLIAAATVLLSSCHEHTVLHGDTEGQSRHSSVLGATADRSDTASDAKTPAENTIESVKIWFVKEQGGELQPAPVERTLTMHDPIKEATDQLLRGPTQSEQETGIKSEIPLGTVILGVEKKGPITELNLSQRFASGGTSSVEARLSQLERTIKDVAGKSKVFLDVEGHRLLTAGDGMEVKQPIN